MINFKNASYKLTLVSHFRFVSFWNCVANEYKRTYIGCSVGKQCVKSNKTASYYQKQMMLTCLTKPAISSQKILVIWYLFTTNCC